MSQPDPIGDLHVERDGASVILRFDEDGEREVYHLPPEAAHRVATWLNQAAADAKQFQHQEGQR